MGSTAFFSFRLAAFSDTSSFTGEFTQIVQFCSPYDTSVRNDDFFNSRGMYRERSFYADAGSNTTNGEHFTYAGAITGNADTFK